VWVAAWVQVLVKQQVGVIKVKILVLAAVFGAVVDPVALIESGILKNVRDGVRILGNGELTKSLTVIANGFTKSAEAKIQTAGGKVEVV